MLQNEFNACRQVDEAKLLILAPRKLCDKQKAASNRRDRNTPGHGSAHELASAVRRPVRELDKEDRKANAMWDFILKGWRGAA